MKELLIDFEEMNMLHAKRRRRSAITQIRLSIGAAVFFGAFAVIYIGICFLYANWWYLISVAIYIAAVVSHVKFTLPRWRRALYKATRELAKSRKRMRRLIEE